MSWTALLLSTVLLQGDPGVGELGLEPRLDAALNELRRRDPAAFRDMRRALKERFADARGRLEQHAQYLDELERAKRENPRRYALLLEQEVAESEVRDAAEGYHLSPEGPERDAARAELRARLEAAFELRHELRELQLDELAGRFAAERARLDETAEDGRSARDAWLERVGAEETPGGDPGSGALDPDELQTLAPGIVRAVMRRDRFLGRQLARLAETSPFQFRRKLLRAIEDHPALLEEARSRYAGEPLELRERLQSRVRFLHKRLRPFRRPGARPALSPEERAELEPVLDEIVEAELSITRFNLGRVERRIAAQRETLAFRRERRDLIVDLRLAELTGEQERYEW